MGPHDPRQSHHPSYRKVAERRAADLQLRVADLITRFAGSMPFVYIHAKTELTRATHALAEQIHERVVGTTAPETEAAP